MKKSTTTAAKKTTAKKTTTAKAATKKTTTVNKEAVAKKTAAKPVKMNIQVQYNYHDVSLEDIENMVVNHLVELGYKKTSILTLDIYYKAETSEVFYFAKTKDKQVLKNEEPLYI